MRLFKRFMIFIAGGLVLMVGAAMIILPGPAVIVIPAGLAILAVEFEWARRLLEKVRNGLRRRRGGHANEKPKAPVLGVMPSKPLAEI